VAASCAQSLNVARELGDILASAVRGGLARHADRAFRRLAISAVSGVTLGYVISGRATASGFDPCSGDLRGAAHSFCALYLIFASARLKIALGASISSFCVLSTIAGFAMRPT